MSFEIAPVNKDWSHNNSKLHNQKLALTTIKSEYKNEKWTESS